MKLTVTTAAGTLAESPGAAVDALVQAATADGAEPEEWLEKAARQAGYRAKSVPANEPQSRVVEEVRDLAVQLYDQLVEQVVAEVSSYLDRAIERSVAQAVHLSEDSHGG